MTRIVSINHVQGAQPIAVSVVAGLRPAKLKHTQLGVHMCSAEAWA